MILSVLTILLAGTFQVAVGERPFVTGFGRCRKYLVHLSFAQLSQICF